MFNLAAFQVVTTVTGCAPAVPPRGSRRRPTPWFYASGRRRPRGPAGLADDEDTEPEEEEQKRAFSMMDPKRALVQKVLTNAVQSLAQMEDVGDMEGALHASSRFLLRAPERNTELHLRGQLEQTRKVLDDKELQALRCIALYRTGQLVHLLRR
jgi:hypothetical protein